MGKLKRRLTRILKGKTTRWEGLKDDLLDFFWYDPIGWCRSKYEMVRRMLYWGWHMRWSWDFDAQTMYEMIYRKLDRLHYVFKNYSHMQWNSDENNGRMKELREARELARRCWQDEYDMKAFYEIEEKYGELKTWSEKLPDEKGLYSYHSLWGGSKEKDEAARPVYRRRSEHWRKVEMLHKKRLWYLIEKNIDGWWD
jgi:hypothetical protein